MTCSGTPTTSAGCRWSWPTCTRRCPPYWPLPALQARPRAPSTSCWTAARCRAWFSRTCAALREAGWLAATITVGQAFGGDLEAVTLHTGLLAARHVLAADLAVVAQGPGNLGTGTRWGFSGVACGEAVNAAAVLNGRPVASLRVSEADPRDRHRGVSHHSLTAYGRVALARADVVVPELPGEFGARIAAQAAPLGRRHASGAGAGGRAARGAAGHPRAAVHDGPRARAGPGLLSGRGGRGPARRVTASPTLSSSACAWL